MASNHLLFIAASTSYQPFGVNLLVFLQYVSILRKRVLSRFRYRVYSKVLGGLIKMVGWLLATEKVLS